MLSTFLYQVVRKTLLLLVLGLVACLAAACVPTTTQGDSSLDMQAAIRAEVSAELTRNAPPTPEPDLQATVNAELTRIAPTPTTEDTEERTVPTDTPIPVPPTDTPTTSPPTVTPTSAPPEVNIPYGIVTADRGVNVRRGPDTEYELLRVISNGTRLEVVGRSLDNEWWQVMVPNLPGGIGWISAIYLQAFNTNGVPVAVAPSLPPTVTPVPMPPTWTPTPPIVNPPEHTLNPNGNAHYATQSLSAGFLPDPWSASVTSGGSINASSAIGNGCSGYASSNPDVVLNWSGRDGLLRIYFEADIVGDDATLIIRLPNGTWSCDDDDNNSTLNPLVHFSSASSGRYSIWVGSYEQGEYISGRLGVTERPTGGPAN